MLNLIYKRREVDLLDIPSLFEIFIKLGFVRYNPEGL